MNGSRSAHRPSGGGRVARHVAPRTPTSGVRSGGGAGGGAFRCHLYYVRELCVGERL